MFELGKIVFKNILEPLVHFIFLLVKSFLSFIYVIMFSKFVTKLPQVKRTQIVFIGNGPSVNEVLSQSKVLLNDCDIAVSNDFARCDLFYQLKPNNYYIVDPAYFRKNNPQQIEERVTEVFNSMNSIDWPMNLFVPYKFYSKTKAIISNDKVFISPFNHTPAEGFNSFLFYLFKNRLAMPKVQNVLIAVLINSINIGYKTIYLWGVEHNWMRYMALNSKGELCLEDHHFYSKESKSLKVWYKNEKQALKVNEALIALSIMFKSYFIIKEYSEYKTVKINNQTPNSLIDAFPYET